MLVDDAVRGGKERKKERRGDVVGEVPEDSQALSFKHGRPVERECVGFDQFERSVRKLRAQERSKITVDFYSRLALCARDHLARERGLARADFNEFVAGFRINRARDALDPVMIVEKVLSEAFAGAMPFKPFLSHGS